VRGQVIALAVAYFAFLGVGVWLLVDGQTGAGETILLMAMAGGWFGSRWLAKRAREGDGE
jgi:uncharacterized RDD family membrane protein YckC